MTKTVIEHIPAELGRDGKTWNVKLELTVKELMTDESISPVKRAIAKAELMPTSGLADGHYALRYVFDGKLQNDSVRLQDGILLSG